LVLVDVSFGDFVEEKSYVLFQRGRRSTRLVTMILFRQVFENTSLRTEIGVQTDNGFRPGSLIIYSISKEV